MSDNGPSRMDLDKITVLLKLYVSTADQKFLAHRVKRVLSQLAGDKFLFVMIDVRVIPKLAEMDNVVATPTLVKFDLQRNYSERLLGSWASDHALKRFLLGMHIERGGN